MDEAEGSGDACFPERYAVVVGWIAVDGVHTHGGIATDAWGDNSMSSFGLWMR